MDPYASDALPLADAHWARALAEHDLIDERWVLNDSAEAVDGDAVAQRDFDHPLDELERVVAHAQLLVADQFRAIAEMLRDAAATPEPWVGPDPTSDPRWVDARGRSVAAVRRDRSDMAVRAAAADIAVRLRMSESTVRNRAADAEWLRERCPMLWAGFLGGVVSEANARTAAAAASTLPDDAAEAWQRFDSDVSAPAARLTPSKFRLRARAVRERVHPESVDARHHRATSDRGVWLAAEADGMAALTAFLPAAAAESCLGAVSAAAAHLATGDAETRTLAQLRADAMIDLLTATSDGGDGTTGWAGARASVAITVPALTLLGADDTPATLDGYGPIDLDTARRLAGEASSWVRILTHPVTGTVLDVDRTTYRVPTALRRWLGVRHPVCIFPGCRRPAADCEIDHTVAWRHGGTTRDTNLAPLCTSHHRVKDETRWALERDDDTGEIWWVSPTGEVTGVDPPPF